MDLLVDSRVLQARVESEDRMSCMCNANALQALFDLFTRRTPLSLSGVAGSQLECQGVSEDDGDTLQDEYVSLSMLLH